jgi:hypothetical protein
MWAYPCHQRCHYAHRDQKLKVCRIFFGIPVLILAADALMSHPWFHGSIPRELSETLLAGYVAFLQLFCSPSYMQSKPEGTYLVRTSSGGADNTFILVIR